MDTGRSFFAPLAWVRGAWARDVLLEVDASGHWARVEEGAAKPPAASTLAGPALPGLVNAHSHAFQRAMAGLAEHAAASSDDFWTWRDRMYRAANRITPEQLETIAAFLYTELLQAGYTQVCEFHYVHNEPGGKPYADAAEMSRALVRAALRAGIGLTLLPTLYMRSGFAAKGLRDDQLRFASTPDSILRIAEEIGRAGTFVNAGVAIHSLRAVDGNALRELAQGAAGMPVHIHIAEQRREVEDCLAEHGKKPVEYLLAQAKVDSRWNLVHATQCSADELAALRSTGASIVICPTTEANLGDGIFDLPSWVGQSGSWSIGSDSHVSRSWREELRLLEYSQRLQLRKRNVAAAAALTESSAGALFEGALQGGAPATGVRLGGFRAGERADFVVIDADSSELLGIPEDRVLDALVFSSPESRFANVFVAGREVRAAERLREMAPAFRDAMRALWS